MKFTFLLVLISTLQLSASVYSQQTTFSVEFKTASVLDLMTEIKSNSEFDFLYSNDEIENVMIHDADFSGAHIEEILDLCLEGTEITYKIDDKVIILMPAPPKPVVIEKQQKVEVHGTVKDTDGNTLPGVSVVLKGTSVGTATDIDGHYVLNIDDKDQVLVFSFIGMNPIEIAYNGQKIINVTMEADSENLDEIVVTGYTKTSKTRQSSSSTKVTSELVERQVTTNLDDKMEGLSTGLSINTVTPDGGQERLELILRGISTFDEEGEAFDPVMQARNALNRQPLIVVDGFPYEGPFNDIDQSTVASMDVLKDAAATALWGLRASNGVIVITTKRGTEGKPKVSLSSNFTFGTKQDLNDFDLASSKDVIDIRSNWMNLNPTHYSNYAYNAVNNETQEPWWWEQYGPGTPFVPEIDYRAKFASLDSFEMIWADFYAGKISDAERDQKLATLGQNDVLPQFEDNLLQNGFVMQNSLSVNGGSKYVNYNFTVSHTDEKKPNKGDEFERLNLSLTTDLTLHKKLKATVDVSLVTSENIMNAIGVASLYTGANNINRFDQLVDADGKSIPIRNVYAPFRDEFVAMGFEDSSYDPIKDQKIKDNSIKNFNIRLAGGLNYKVTDWLTADLKYQYNRVEMKTLNNRLPGSYRMRSFNNSTITVADDGTGAGVTRAIPYGGRLERKVDVTTYKILRGTLNFNKVFAKDHVVSGIAGMEATENEFTVNQLQLTGYNDKTGLYDQTFDHYQFGQYGSYESILGGYYTANNYFTPSTISRTVSSFSNIGYSYKAKYNIEASAKLAQATAFGINKKLSKNLYWAISGSWNIAKENFVNAEWLDALKLRASYGKNGNMRRGLTSVTTIAYSTRDYMTDRNYTRVDSPGNPNLAPEETTTQNLGLDFTIFNRFMGSIDVYDKRSEDLLVLQNTNSSFGIGSVYSNEGEISNKGIEFSLQADILKKTELKWNANFNISYNKNEVIKYGYRPTTTASSYYYDVDGGRSKVIGKDVSTQVRYRWAGLDANGNPQVYNRNGDVISYSDPEFNLLTQDDMRTTKPFIAPVYGGLTNTFTYKNFTLSAMMTYKFGHQFQEALNAKYGYVSGGFGNSGWHKDVGNAWTPENMNTDIPALPRDLSETAYERQSAFELSDYTIMNAAHIRLKDITLNYEFSKDLVRKAGLNRASLMFQVRNLGLLWTANKKDIDPESVPFSGREITFGGSFPQAYRPGIRVPVSFVIGAKIEF